MPIIHITKTNVERLVQPENGRVDYFDDDLKGFGVRVSAESKTYFTLRRVNGKLVRTKIDTADKVTAEKARKQAEGTLADMGRGTNPNEVKRQARQQTVEETQQAVTLSDAFDTFLENRKLKPRTKAVYKQLVNFNLADWLNLPATEINSAMINERHKDIATGKRHRAMLKKEVTTNKQSGKKEVKKVVPEATRREASADGTMRVLRAVLNYTFADDEDMGILRVNPVRTLSRKKAWFKVPGRRTLVKNSDLPAWYKAVKGLENSIASDYLQFLLFTGLRREEAASLTWKQVDFEEGCFTIVDTKNKEPHTLPLSDFLHNLLKDRQEGLKIDLASAKAALALAKLSSVTLTTKQWQTLDNRVATAEAWLASRYVFPGTGKSGHIQDPKRNIDEVMAATGIVFTCHDLRRTFATLAESLDLSSYTVKALLNHKQQAGDVTGGYIILNVDRLREPMQKVTNAIQERIKKQHGQVLTMQARAK